TPQGTRRAQLLEQARSNITFNSQQLSAQLLNSFNSGEPLQKSQLEHVLYHHAQFLSGGGAGGTFQVVIRDALPQAIYENDDLPDGQANLALENLAGLKLSSCQLAYGNLCGIRCENAQWNKAYLRGSCLSYAFLVGAKFQGADLSGCDFTGARLAGADFRKANLTNTNFENADLSQANFASALTAGTKFGGATVRGIKY